MSPTRRRNSVAKAPSLFDHLELCFPTVDAKALDLRNPISDAKALVQGTPPTHTPPVSTQGRLFRMVACSVGAFSKVSVLPGSCGVASAVRFVYFSEGDLRTHFLIVLLDLVLITHLQNLWIRLKFDDPSFFCTCTLGNLIIVPL